MLATPINLRPVRMKNSLYLLVPKGVAELLDLNTSRECTLTVETGGSDKTLKYSFALPEGQPPEVSERQGKSEKPLIST